MKNPPSLGECQLCQAQFAKNTISRHLKKCLVQHEPARGRQEKLFQLVAEGYGPYWLHLEMPGDATLADLDNFLRNIWLECCGHMSAFEFRPAVMQRLGIQPGMDADLLNMDFLDDEVGDEESSDSLMDRKLADVLEPKLAFEYEYDFGSTTHLKLKVAGIRDGKWAGKGSVRLLARNLPPNLVCGNCGQPAKKIDVDGGELYCSVCARKENSEYLLPVVNSPRMGVCGYTGKQGAT